TRFSRDWSSDVCSSDLFAHASGERIVGENGEGVGSVTSTVRGGLRSAVTVAGRQDEHQCQWVDDSADSHVQSLVACDAGPGGAENYPFAGMTRIRFERSESHRLPLSPVDRAPASPPS